MAVAELRRAAHGGEAAADAALHTREEVEAHPGGGAQVSVLYGTGGAAEGALAQGG